MGFRLPLWLRPLACRSDDDARLREKFQFSTQPNQSISNVIVIFYVLWLAEVIMMFTVLFGSKRSLAPYTSTDCYTDGPSLLKVGSTFLVGKIGKYNYLTRALRLWWLQLLYCYSSSHFLVTTRSLWL